MIRITDSGRYGIYNNTVLRTGLSSMYFVLSIKAQYMSEDRLTSF